MNSDTQLHNILDLNTCFAIMEGIQMLGKIFIPKLGVKHANYFSGNNIHHKRKCTAFFSPNQGVKPSTRIVAVFSFTEFLVFLHATMLPLFFCYARGPFQFVRAFFQIFWSPIPLKKYTYDCKLDTNQDVAFSIFT